MTTTERAAEIARAVELLRAGELVAFPTETVYGLGADASNPDAVAKIFAAKGRPQDHPLIVHLPSAAALDRWARDITPAARRLAAGFWPGPLTLILKRQPGVIDAITGGQDTVGLRVPKHPLALELLKAFGGATGDGLAAPSANRFGRISPTTAEHVREELGERVALVLDGGPCRVGIESTIVDLTGAAPRILRPGAVTAEQLAAALGQRPAIGIGVGSGEGEAPRVSGSLAAHYAPRTPLRLVAGKALVAAARAALGEGKRVAVLAREVPGFHGDGLEWFLAPLEPAPYAQDLYATLRRLDASHADLILVETLPDEPEWLAVSDRLGRAAFGSGAAAA